MKVLTTIATHNGGLALKRCIDSCIETGCPDICLVNNATNDEFSNSVIDDNRERTNVLDNKKSVYDTGAYIQSFKKFGDDYDYFMFTQDDTEFKYNNWKEDLIRLSKEREDNVVIVLSIFNGVWDNDEQKDFIRNSTGIADLSDEVDCIFGPMFFTHKKNMKAVFDKYGKDIEKLITYNKNDQQAMERGWGYIFHSLGIPLHSVMGKRNCPVFKEDWRPGIFLQHYLLYRI